MSRPIFSELQQRYLDLIGDPDGTIDAFGNRNINNSIKNILNQYSFSWDIKTANLTLTAGVANLPTDFNPIWGLSDARIVQSSTEDDYIFTQILPRDRDSYTTDDYVYWITYDTASDVYVFNSLTQTGTVAIYYYFLPTDLSGASDVCIVPDIEAVSYLAASKNWIGSERDIELKREYEQEANKYITALYVRDLSSGPDMQESSLSGTNLS